MARWPSRGRFCDDVEFSPEDATRSELEFLCRVVQTAVDAGATTINIPDTVGYTVPEEFAAIIRHAARAVRGIENVILSVHCHDDLGLAVANTLAAIDAGARQVECTINGIGERAGNAALEEIAMAMRVRQTSCHTRPASSTEKIYPHQPACWRRSSASRRSPTRRSSAATLLRMRPAFISTA